MSLFYPLTNTHINTFKPKELRRLKPIIYLLVQYGMIIFQAENVIRISRYNFLGNLFLGTHCINGDDAARLIQHF